MAIDQFSRTRLVFGDAGVDALAHKHVAVFGIGGVGGHAAEALVRTGVGAIDLVDSDTVSVTNINRQIIATWNTVDMPKVDAMETRLLSINPNCRITKHQCFFLPETADQFDFASYDYVIDAVDTVTAKIQLIMQAQAAGVPVISAMGAGNKTDPTALHIADLYETSVCPLARIMRKELRKRGVRALKVAYSTEPPAKPFNNPAATEKTAAADAPAGDTAHSARHTIPGSNAFVPGAMGLAIAAEVVKDLVN